MTEIKKTVRSLEEAKEMARKLQHECVDKNHSVTQISTTYKVNKDVEGVFFHSSGEKVTIQIKPEPEHKKGVLGLAWDNNESAKAPCFYKERDGKIHDVYFRKSENGYTRESFFDNFEPLPNYERALELVIEAYAPPSSKADLRDHCLTLANKELLK